MLAFLCLFSILVYSSHGLRIAKSHSHSSLFSTSLNAVSKVIGIKIF